MNKTSLQEPFDKFNVWFQQACDNKKIVEPTAMCLSSIDENNLPSSRMVLLKNFDARGFCFYTNLTSRKGQNIIANPNVALCFYWGVLGFQVRIEGRVEPVSTQEADEYFASRRRESQIGAWASKQSSEMKNWQEFQDRIADVTTKFANKEVTRPPFWSGFRVVPTKIELWQEGEFRVHTRDVYERYADGWDLKLIYP